MSMYEKPPVGVAPHWFIYRARMRDLSEAISRYLEWIQAHENTERSGPYYEAIAKWSEELKTLATLESRLQEADHEQS